MSGQLQLHCVCIILPLVSQARPSYEKIKKGSGAQRRIRLSPWNVRDIIECDVNRQKSAFMLRHNNNMAFNLRAHVILFTHVMLDALVAIFAAENGDDVRNKWLLSCLWRPHYS